LGKEAWHWHFGQNASLDFSSGVPVPGLSPINTQEGTACYSDPNTGQLLFYTDGITVWDKNNNQMPNGFGLLGGISSTQSALIVPIPCSTSLFYIFTSSQNGINSGYNYSLVDMNLNGGLGDISLKNQFLYAPNCEKLTGTKHSNTSDYWVVTHELLTDEFRAYLITNAGINLTPIISNVGSVYNDQAHMKISPNGTKIASVAPDIAINTLELLDFNPSNGVVSNPITMSHPSFFFPFGVSFSPNGSLLYMTDLASVYQMDISSNNSAIISSSVINLGISGQDALQIGPDNKIYMTNLSNNFLNVINAPNNLGLGCNLQINAINLGSASAFLSLPNFSYLPTPLTSSITVNSPTICAGNTTTLVAISNLGTSATYSWSNGSVNSPSIIVAPVVNTNYTVTVNSGGCSAIAVSSVIVNSNTVPTTIFSYGASTICQNAANPLPILVNGFTSGGTYTSTSGLTINPSTGIIDLASSNAGSYIVTYSVAATSCSSAGTHTTSIVITPALATVTNFSYNSPVCSGNQTLTPNQSVGFTNGGNYTSTPFISGLNSVTGIVDLSNSSSGTYTINYSVPASACVTAGSSTTAITVNQVPSLLVSPDVSIVFGSSTTLMANSSSPNYTWNPSTNLSCINCDSPIASPPETTKYCVQTSNGTCDNTVCVLVTVETICTTNENLKVPNAFTPNGDGNNDQFCLQGWNSCSVSFLIRIFNRWGEKVFESTDPDFCWDGTYKGQKLNAEVFVYYINASFTKSDEIIKKGNISLIN
jgi:gliding motility-associated-like protein